MSELKDTQLFPPLTRNSQGKERRVGIEIELAGMSGNQLASAVRDVFDGSIEEKTIFEYRVVGTSLGDFKLELDSAFVKDLATETTTDPTEQDTSLAGELKHLSDQAITYAAEQLVPWEIVAPPVVLSRLPEFGPLVDLLRQSGAKGTRHALRFAFGVHLNPELPALDAQTILRYIRAYFCLYDWLAHAEDIDISRRATPYINHFDQSYIQKVISDSYTPDITTLIDDYLEANPTRNRGLDMLPLFAYLDKERVELALKDERVQARPTLHYRLPNCDIDNPQWCLTTPWTYWLEVERLATDAKQLEALCSAYNTALENSIPLISDGWLAQCQHWIEHGTLENNSK